MKKKNLATWVCGLLVLTACGGKGPGDALQDYMDDMQNEDYVGFVDGMNFKEELTKEQKEQFAAMIEEKASNKPGVKEYKVLRDSILVEDSLAVVIYEVVYDNGSTDTEKQTMVKKDGKWLMDIGK